MNFAVPLSVVTRAEVDNFVRVSFFCVLLPVDTRIVEFVGQNKELKDAKKHC